MFILNIKKLEKNIQFYINEFECFFTIDNNSILYIDCFGKLKKTNDFVIYKFFYETIFGQDKHLIWNFIKDMIDDYTYNLDNSLKLKKNKYSNENIFVPLIKVNEKIHESIIIFYKQIENEKKNDNNAYLFLKDMKTYIYELSIIFSIYKEKVNQK